MDFKFILKVFIIAFIILSFINLFIFRTVNTIEGLETIILNKTDAFCENHRGSSGTLDKSCKKLTKNNCNSTSCCVWTSDNKCVAGGKDGATFNTDSNGKTKDLDYFYFKNKCYGKC